MIRGTTHGALAVDPEVERRMEERRLEERARFEPAPRRSPVFEDGGPLSKITTLRPRTFTEAQKAELNGRGYSLKEVAPSYGNQQVLLWRKKTGNVDAASDPRGIGLAAGTTVHY